MAVPRGFLENLMQLHSLNGSRLFRRLLIMSICGLMLTLRTSTVHAQAGTQTTPKTPPAVGTIKSISGNTLVLATDSGPEVKVQLPGDVKVMRVPPGSVNLKEAMAIQL